MTREEIVKVLRACSNDTSCSKCTLRDSSLDFNCMYFAMMCAADMLEQDARGWISIKDKMPNREGRYLVAVGNDFDDVCIAEYDGKEFGETVPEYDGLGHVFEDWDAIKFATHWAEMPCPQKEANHEDH